MGNDTQKTNTTKVEKQEDANNQVDKEKTVHKAGICREPYG